MDVEQQSQDGNGAREEEVNLVRQTRDTKKAKEKQRKPVKVLRVEDLVDREKGLRMLYDAVKKEEPKLHKKAATLPDKALQDYVELVQDWAFNLAPKYEISYFFDRTQTLGRKKEVVEELEKLRKYHKKELTYNPDRKDYELADNGPRRQVLTIDGPVVDTTRGIDEAGLAADDYDQLREEDRGFEYLPTKDDIDYDIKKKVKLNPGASPSVKDSYHEKMDEEF